MPRYDGDVDEDGIHIGVTEPPQARVEEHPHVKMADVKASRGRARTSAQRTPGEKR